MTSWGDLDELQAEWTEAFLDAQRLWSPALDLPAPRFCRTATEERAAGLDAGFARVRHADRSVSIGLDRVIRLGIEAHAPEALAHIVGHLVLAPGDLAHHARLLARVRAGLTDQRRFAPLVANVWSDLVVDHRLRAFGIDTAPLLEKLGTGPLSPLVQLHLQAAQAADLDPGPDELDLDARLASRLVQLHGDDWLAGATPFARLVKPHVATLQPGVRLALNPDTVGATVGTDLPAGLAAYDHGEHDPTHPVNDVRVTGQRSTRLSVGADSHLPEGTEFRSPSLYLELIEALDITRPRSELVAQYYRDRARPLLLARPRSATPPPDLVLGLLALAESDPGSHLSPLSLFASVEALLRLRSGARVVIDWGGPDDYFAPSPGFEADEQVVLETLTVPVTKSTRPGHDQLRRIATHLTDSPGREVLLVSDHRLTTELNFTPGGWDLAHQIGALSSATLVLRDAGRNWKSQCRLFMRRGWQVHHIDEWDELIDLAAGLPATTNTADLLSRRTEEAPA
ncbi:MAG: hypothetical protein GY745_16755 [Actinomycetia bacterium]|nr:hypothetical protein [Actinomycetes bacterium]